MKTPPFVLAASLILAANFSTIAAKDVQIEPALAAVNNLTGDVIVSSGALRIQDAAALSGVTSVSVLSPGALELAGGIQIPNIPLSVSGRVPRAAAGCAASPATTPGWVRFHSVPIMPPSVPIPSPSGLIPAA